MVTVAMDDNIISCKTVVTEYHNVVTVETFCSSVSDLKNLLRPPTQNCRTVEKQSIFRSQISVVKSHSVAWDYEIGLATTR
jgi:hypothetical protein